MTDSISLLTFDILLLFGLLLAADHLRGQAGRPGVFNGRTRISKHSYGLRCLNEQGAGLQDERKGVNLGT